MESSWMKLALNFCLLATFAVVIVFAATRKPAREAANDYLTSGRAKYAHGDLEGAIADFQQAITLFPDGWQAYAACGRAEYADALRQIYLSRGQTNVDLFVWPPISPKPNDLPDYLRFGRRLDSAWTNLSCALSLKPDDATCYFYRGLVAVYEVFGPPKGREKAKMQALADLDRSIKLDPNFPTAYYFRAGVRATLTNLDGAISDYGRAVALAGTNSYAASALWFRAKLRNTIGDSTGAQSDHQMALQIWPQADSILWH
jgi:tetratricopeptide (TPR) repeat protein